MCGLVKKESVPSPSDIVPRSSIKDIDGNIVIDLAHLNIPFTKHPKRYIPPIPPTKSMVPLFYAGHNNILIAGADKENQEIMIEWIAQEWITKKKKNICVFDYPGAGSIIHHIVKIDCDDLGRIWTFKGYANYIRDPYPVRDTHIQWLSIGPIY